MFALDFGGCLVFYYCADVVFGCACGFCVFWGVAITCCLLVWIVLDLILPAWLIPDCFKGFKLFRLVVLLRFLI